MNATCAMQVGRHHFCAESLEWLKRQTSAGLLSRSALAEGLCESERWVNHRGELCLGSGRKALPVHCDRLKLALPGSGSGVAVFAGGSRTSLASVGLKCGGSSTLGGDDGDSPPPRMVRTSRSSGSLLDRVLSARSAGGLGIASLAGRRMPARPTWTGLSTTSACSSCLEFGCGAWLRGC